MFAIEVYTIVIIAGITKASTVEQDKTDEVEIFINTFIDYLISLMRLIFPEPMKMNKSPNSFINLANASIYGVRHVERGCSVKLDVYSTAENDYISCTLCVDFKDFFKVDGLFQISAFFYDTEFNPAILQLFNFTVKLNLTLTLPKVYRNTTEALLHLDGTPQVEISRLKFSPPPNASKESAFDFLSELTSFMSSGPFGGFIEARIGSSIRKAIKRVNENIQKSVGKFVNKLT